MWERNHDVWGAALTHGIWNTTVTGTWVATFSGPDWLLDEFGLLAPATVAVVALVLVPFLVSGVPAARRPLSS